MLGFIVNKEGIKMEREQISMILDWPEPTTLTQVQELVGFVNFYRRFIYNISGIMKPITDLTQKSTRQFQWTPTAREALNKLKKCFISEPLLRRLDNLKPIHIYTNALGYAAAAILMQRHKNNLHPVAFWSQKFTNPERNYPIMEQELLPIVEAMNHWRHYCEGASHTIQIYTDHHNLRYFNTMERISGHLACWSLQLQRFNYEIYYRPGKKNLADAPSRRPDYYLNDNDPNKPAQFHLSFHTTYPEHHRGDMNLCLDATTLSRSLHQEIINENTRDTYLSIIKAKTNLEGWSTKNGT